MLYRELSLPAQSAYAEILDQKQAEDLASLSRMPGSFHKKTVKGHHYWYFGFRGIDGRSQMIYIGPECDRVNELIARFRSDHEHPASSAPMAKAAIALGCSGVAGRHYRIIEKLSHHGLFRAGGILIGTHAFNAIGNMLGVRWGDGSKTMDVDIAHPGNNISLALPSNVSFDQQSAIDALEMGRLPIIGLGGKRGAQYRNPASPDLRVDFVTCEHRRNDDDPYVRIPGSNFVLEPLKFMEFSLEKTTQACILGNTGAVVVNIPSPERFAIHKLIVFGERDIKERTKANKDVMQAASIIAFLLDNHMAREVFDTIEDARSRGRGWNTRLDQGFESLGRHYPDIHQRIASAKQVTPG